MEWQAWFTLAVIGCVLAAMVREIASPDLLLMAGLFTLAAAGILTPEETFAGFANEGMATVAALFILAAALRGTGAIEVVFGRLFGRATREGVGLLRICLPVAGLSAFLNNTPIVAMMTPVVMDWARRGRQSPSRYLIPLDYATILGGNLTLIGTSTNLVVAGLLIQAGFAPMGFFELTPVGIPVCAAGLVYLLLVAPRLLPRRKDLAEQLGERRREYTGAMIVDPQGPLVGRSVEEAGLRHLPGLFVVEIDRGGRVITPVAPDQSLLGDDRLVFAGVVSTILDLQRMRGLVPATHLEEPASVASGRRLVEAVVSHSSPLVGRSIRDANFRTVYDAAVIAVHRNAEAVPGKIGEIVLRPGDTLLLQTAPGFLRAHHNNPDFYLVSEIPEAERPRFDRAWVAVGVMLAMVVTATAGLLPISVASFLAAGALVVTRCISAGAARRSVDFPTLIVIAAGLGIARAMDKTGAAEAVARVLTTTVQDLGPVAELAIIYFATALLTEILTNNAAAALMFPIAVATGQQLGVDPRGFAMAVAVAASCGFASPLGYATHLIVYGPGGYRFTDFTRVGLPLDLLCGAVAIALIPWIWPF